ncbi:MAG: histidinol-phosphatase [Rhodopirellula sp. TMED11]|nr:MAG: histidinol-phosphatase [Rhodopirellula sp. TMED11]
MNGQANNGQLPATWGSEHEGRLTALHEIVTQAGQSTLSLFGDPSLHVDAKSDDSPVTVADRGAEKLARELITAAFPKDTVQGEEFAEHSGESSYRWVIDPIDGTKSFICGVPLYSTLLALECDGEPVAGAIYIPALGEMLLAALGQGCWYQPSAGADWSAARVSTRDSLDQAVFLTSQVDSFDERGDAGAYQALQSACRLSRSWGDGYGYLLVATGRADIMVDPICNAWDVAAMLPIVQEAGGRFTDWKGNSTVRGGDGVGSNGLLHQSALDLLGG